MHTKEISDLFSELKTGLDGLTKKEAEFRLDKYGANELTIKKRKPVWLHFIQEFTDLMVLILIFAAIVAGLAGEKADAIVILSIVLLNAIIGFIQKYKAEKAIEALKKLVAPTAKVIRNEEEIQIPARELVPGDIIVLVEGDKIPADARLIEANELETQESLLTGESMPVRKNTDPHKEIQIGDKSNFVYMGTDVAHGSGKAVVVHTGMDTEFGKIAHLTTTTKKDKSPLQKELFRIGVFVGKITFVISGILILVGYFVQHEPFVKTFLFASSVAVAAVPEGLPATVTIALALGVQKLARRNAIMKQLSSVETLGSTTVICSDKTGTLTKNEMTVKEVYFDKYSVSVRGVGYKPWGSLHIKAPGEACCTIGDDESMYEDYEHRRKNLMDIERDSHSLYSSLEMLNQIGVLCNNAKLKEDGILGDPTEGSLLTLALKAGFEIEKIHEKFEKIHEIPFDSERKRMSVIVKDKVTGKRYILTKGAPDSIIERCSHTLSNGRPIILDQESKNKVLGKNEAMAKRALRNIGFAFKEIDKKQKYHEEADEKNLIFVGLVGMIDPPRPEVKEAVDIAKRAGIKVYVITGDYGLTAEAIAKQLNLISNKNDHTIITGKDLDKISDKELGELLKDKKNNIIFARVNPKHKLKIVSVLKTHGEIVAVTGDGINDAPALKRADIGIAMGQAGTDVSREASNMVLADDSFSTIVTAIKEGRRIYENLKKFIFYIFSCNIGELITIFAAILLGIPAPLTAILILAVDIGTDVLPALALGIDPAEKGIMSLPPRSPKIKILNWKFIARFTYVGFAIGAIVVGTYIWSLLQQGWVWGETLEANALIHVKSATLAFGLLVFIQMVNAFNSRSDHQSVFKMGLLSNIYLLGAILISFGVVYIFVEVPFFQQYMHTTDLHFTEWLLIISISFGILFIEEIRKFFVRRLHLKKIRT